MKIAITTSSFGVFDTAPLKLCEDVNISYVINPYGRVITEDEAIDLYKDCIGVVAGTETISQKVIDASPTLKVISRVGAGINNVDVNYAKEQGIAVLCTPNAPTQATAEHAVTLLLALLRHTAAMDSDMRKNIWEKRMGNLLHKKKVGIIGYGRIGKTFAKLLSGFDCEIACNDPNLKDGDYPNYSLEELLGWADIISLHCSKAKDTPALLDAKTIAYMKKGSWLINVARGDLVDEAALIKSLRDGHLKGAALDVFQTEPYKGELLELENVLLTPHASSYAKESRIDMETQAVINLLTSLGLYNG